MTKNILVVGDLMMDRFVYGKVSRISPEAPIPVLTYEREMDMPGGAGNVALNLVAQGCHVRLIGRVGVDAEGEQLLLSLKNSSVDVELFQDRKVPTVRKTRYISGTAHLLREDRETVVPFTATAKFRAAIARGIRQAAVVLLSDYGKGFLTHDICSFVIEECRRRHISVIIDPKGNDYSKYRGAFLVKPNLKELSDATGVAFDLASRDWLAKIKREARGLMARYRFGGILVTLGEAGMVLVSNDIPNGVVSIPAEAREVFDVSGAGDTALAALAAALANGRKLLDAVKVANVASGIAVSKVGTAVVSAEEITGVERQGRVVPREAVRDFVAKCRQQGRTVGFTNGCFDCCHLGHLSSLQQARALCDVLIVGVNTDRWIRKHKGRDRPIQDEKTRANLLSSLKDVSAVVVFDEETALPLVKEIKPDVVAKEGYAFEDWPEGRWVNAHGGRAVVLSRVDGYSTTEIVRRLKGPSA